MTNLATQQQSTPVVTFLSAAEGQDLPVCSYDTDQRIRGYLSKDPEATQRLQDFFQACQAVGESATSRLMDVAISLSNVKGEDSEAWGYLQQCIIAHSRGVFSGDDVGRAKASSLVLRKLRKHPELRAKAEGSSINALAPLSYMREEHLHSFIADTPRLTVKACRDFASLVRGVKRGRGDREGWDVPKTDDPKTGTLRDVAGSATSRYSTTVTSLSVKEEAKMKLGTSAPIETTTPTPTPEAEVILETNSTLPPHLQKALNSWPVPMEKIERLEEVFLASPSFPSVEPVEAPEGLDGPIGPETTQRGPVASPGALQERSYSRAPLTTAALVDRHTVRMLTQALTVKLEQAPELTSDVPVPARQELEVQLTNTLKAIEGMLAKLQGLEC